jgi:hypothetical protein
MSPSFSEDDWMKRTLIALALFAVAMGFLEAAVVVYLRLQLYPDGFSFPLVQMPQNILITEIAREVATIIMLSAIAWIAGHDRLSRFCYFAVAFGIWDIFYYVFLKILLNWPASLFTDDILFLIPLPWVGPVLAPVLVSLCLIGGGVAILHRQQLGRPVTISPMRWVFMILGALIVLASFLQNSVAAMHQQPITYFNWFLFATGIAVSLGAFVASLKEQQ